MSKRKAGVNDIIYELDNDDIELSSEDEGKHPKINRLEPKISSQPSSDDVIIEETPVECIDIDCSTDTIEVKSSPTKAHNGGKSANIIQLEDDDEQVVVEEDDIIQKQKSNTSESSLFNEDIVVDSPASNTDLGVAGCENRTPLFTVRFKDSRTAKAYKEEIKAFMLKLIKLHDSEALEGSDAETDLELDIWPEDLQGAASAPQTESQEEPEEQDNFFFVDTDPSTQEPDDIPRYKQASTLICNVPAKEPTPPPVLRRGPTCFNCDGAHPLRDCTVPRDNARIAEKRKNMVKVGRYHVEDEQKYGHLIPGRISGNLRHALGLKRSEIPLYIYRMRLLGYPPGWLEEARISHSGITMFDSTGSAIRDPEEEEGEVCEPGSKDKFDIKKILDFPGFNVTASSRYREEAHLYGLPPISEQDSKISMLQMLAPNAMKAYKRKKLTFFPSADKAKADGQAEMELDSGDEVAEFPSVPPLPDDAPPPPPPPPDCPPPPPECPPPPPDTVPPPPASVPPASHSPPPPPESSPPPTPPKSPEPEKETDKLNETDDVEIVAVTEVKDIPMPLDASHITIEDDLDKTELSSGHISPSLDDLEEKKQLLLNALQTDVTLPNSPTISLDAEPSNIPSEMDIASESETEKEVPNAVPLRLEIDSNPSPSSIESPNRTPNEARTPTLDSKGVKTTAYGTPVLNIASPYVKLPSDSNFAKDICDVINFENLPNSTGKYKKISNLLKKVKSEVDRIHDS
ncbi:zinc finger CCHC domain-containing protein 8 homolog [Leguminivora glycinivorella]|uniref:zinc finger CCHC domain-containing protein 8 homolog n=1 Tax=Leguminivora glycinivorella TaxID=1035111 RepID=UPI00200F9136|nr:zinc finger CCHC domain-containing protein 8 homolog [Leguminivora glycinivorella]